MKAGADHRHLQVRAGENRATVCVASAPQPPEQLLGAVPLPADPGAGESEPQAERALSVRHAAHHQRRSRKYWYEHERTQRSEVREASGEGFAGGVVAAGEWFTYE